MNYKFYLKKNITEYYILNGTSVTTTTTKTDLGRGVVANWNEIGLNWKRGEKRHGIITSYADGDQWGVKFAGKAATILRELFYNRGGLMAECTFYIEQGGDGVPYSELFTSTVKFSSFKDYHTYVDVIIQDIGVSATLAAYQSVNVEIPINTADAVKVLMDGINIKTQYRFLSQPHFDFVNTFSGTANVKDIGITFVRQIGDYTPANGYNVIASTVGGAAMLSAVTDTSFTFDFDFEFDATLTGVDNQLIINYTVWQGAIGGTAVSSGNLWFSPVLTAAGGTVRLRATGTSGIILMPANSQFELKFALGNYGVTSTINYTVVGLYVNNANFVTLSASSTPSDNIRLGYRWGQVFRKLVAKIAGSAAIVQSTYMDNNALNPVNYYDAIPYQNVILSEQSLKQLTSTPVIKISLSDMIKDAIAGLGADIGIIGNVVTVEPISYYYQKNVLICDIGSSITEPEITQIPTSVINKILAGYATGDAIDDINGVNEFNAQQEWLTPVSQVVENSQMELDIRRPIAGAPYYIELTRLQNVNNTITVNNTKRDAANKNFVVYTSNLQTAGAYELRRGFVLSGVEYPEKMYNVPIDGTRNMFRLAPLLKSYFYGLPNQVIKFGSTEQNKNMVSTVTNTVGSITQCADFDIKNLTGDTLFKPYEIKLQGKLPADFATRMRANPYGVIRANYNGAVIEGYVLNARITPAKPDAHDIRLLCSPNCNIQDVIRARLQQ